MKSYIYHGKEYSARDVYTTDIFELPVQYIPQLLYAIEQQKDANDWIDELNWYKGYNDLCAIQWELLMGSAVDRLIMELRATRGVDELTADVFDPNSDPFQLNLGHLEKLAVNLEGVNAKVEIANTKLEAIRLLVEAMQNSETLEDIKASAAQIALLLA